ncbi:ABC transporter permease [Ligilactobacillus acidipiscis]|uniref:Transport protein n=1 Tax=Ligilactobacillus acidipiscis TaxID=89059 RepID=A0A0R2JU43_9LACO|nr:iron export ABC transporter permease subunit FetB [Ligilactobacillus acidipiscis]KRN78885.1 transport protein [Ligilactobacillus acidipiscis]SFV41788.1 YbbM seven transmembrane helix protein [Ligilactobacillus acidipiscis]
MNLAVNNQGLALAFVLVLITMGIAYKEKLQVNKEIITSVIRAIVQLFLVGYLLKYVFRANNNILTIALALIIVFNASYNAMKRSQGIEHGFRNSFLAIFISTGVTLTVLIGIGTIKMIPSQLVPITGMIASNAMVAIGICYRNLNQAFRDQRQQLLERLALGADLKDASLPILQETIKIGIQPTIDSAKTVGIVSLPGMMSGLIFAGVDPVRAIKYQILVTFMLLSTTGIASFIACYLSYRSFYNERKQLL